MTNTALEVLYTRRSVRKYLPRQVEEEKLEAILKAGMYAPSGHNKQPALMVGCRTRKPSSSCAG